MIDVAIYWREHVAPFVRAKLDRSERGAALVEYALLLALIAVVCIIAVTLLGNNAKNKFNSIGSSLQ